MLTFAIHHGGRLYRALILLAFISTFLLAAACLSVRFWLLPNIEQFHPQITALLGRSLGLEVRIAKIEADWLGWRPHLALTDVQLLDAHRQVGLRLKRVDTALSWMTLPARELRLAQLQIDDADLLIRRDAQGVLHIAGLNLSGAESDGQLSDWLLHQSQILLSNVRLTWQDDFLHAPILRVTQAQFRLENRHQRHRFALRFTPPAALAAGIEIRGDFSGQSLADLARWQGELFSQLNQGDIKYLSQWLPLPAELTQAQGNVRAWFGIQGGKLVQVTTDLALLDLKSQFAPNLPSLQLSRIQGRLNWKAQTVGWQLALKKLVLGLAGEEALTALDAELRLAGSADKLFSAGELRLNRVELERLSALAPFLPLPDSVRQRWAALTPRGQVSEVHLKWQGTENPLPQIECKARFNALALKRVGDFPGVEGLTGEINGSEQHGELAFNAPNLLLDASQWLLAPLRFSTFNGQASWQHLPDSWLIKVGKLSLANADAAGTAFGSFQTQPNSLGLLDLNLKLSRASVNKVVRYLPKKQLSAEVMAWLQDSLLAGEASEAELKLRGKLEDFPFADPRSGLFQVNAKAHGVLVDYAKGWPRVENANATLNLTGAHLQLNSDLVHIDQAHAHKVSINIADLTSREPVVDIQGEATDETAHGLSFIRHSPVRDMINGFADPVTAKGRGTLAMHLLFPLSDKPMKLAAQYHFIDNEIELGRGIPSTHHVNGDLSVTESSLNSKNITFEALGAPAKLAIHTAADGALKANVQGALNVAHWRKLANSAWLPYFSGETPWSADIVVQEKRLGVSIHSTLQGLAIQLPAPLAKSASASLPLKFELHTAGADKDVVWLQLGDFISARLLRRDDAQQIRHFSRGYVNFGRARRIVDRDGFWLLGTLPLLSLEGWNGLPNDASNEEFALPAIAGVDVTIQKLTGFGSTFNDLSLHAHHHDGIFTAQLASKALSGELSWLPQGNGKLVARLKNVSVGELNKQPEVRRDDAALTLSQRLQTLALPVLDVVVENFNYQGRSLGRLELNANQSGNAILLNNLKISNSDGVLSGNGKWTLAPAQMHLALKLDMSDAGKLLSRVGYPESLRNGKGSLEGDWVWSGGPDELALGNLEGQLSLNMSKGQFLQLDPGAGKLLSVLSLQALPKRITLDFTDVFSSGFEFDSMLGTAQIRQGVMMTQDFKIEGSAAQVNLLGQVDLSHETQSLRVKVLPTLGNSVSLLAFAAGPVVGAGVFLANKILRDPLDKLAAFEYSVSGNWADPKVEKIGQTQVRE